jgi:hypothetical protein
LQGTFDIGNLLLHLLNGPLDLSLFFQKRGDSGLLLIDSRLKASQGFSTILALCNKYVR